MKLQLPLLQPFRLICPPARPFTSRWRVALLLACGLVAGCGGGGGGTDQPETQLPEVISGTVSNGVVMDSSNFQGLDVGVKGHAGTARETSSVGVTTRYSVTLAQLDPPYLLSANVLDGVRLLAPATEQGTANLTPLTTLMAAWLLGTEPAAYFDNTLGGQGGVPVFTQAEVSASQAEVTRYLARVTGVELSAAVTGADWVTAPMVNEPGDPMFDQIVALNSALDRAGSSLSALASEVAAQQQRCSRQSVAVSSTAGTSRFCQKESSAAYTSDNQARVFSFVDVEGSSLTLTVRQGAAEQVSYLSLEGQFTCRGAAACAGVTVGALGADDTVPIALDGLTLQSPSGAAVLLEGSLAGAGALPTLPCETDKLYLIDPAGPVTGLCLYQAGSNRRGAQTDAGWGSLDGELPYNLAVISDGTAVVSIDVWWYEPATGTPLTLYRCEGSACAGATLGEAYDGVDSYGDPVRLRDYSLRNVPLVAVDSAGRLGTEVAMRLTATLTNPVPGAGFTPDCSRSTEHNTVRFSDNTPALDVCPPPPSSDDYYSFKNAYPYYVPGVDDAVNFTVSTYVVPQDGSVAPLNTINVVLSGDQVLQVFLQTTGDTRSFSCAGAACTGVSVSGLDEQGQRSIDFQGTVLTEDPLRQVPGDGTTATVTGGFLTLPDPYFVPLSAAGRPAAR